MRTGDVLHQRKTQAASLCVVHQRVANAIELLENLQLLARRDADAMINDLEFYAAIFPVEIDTKILTVLRVLECVVHEIDQRARHGLAVHLDGWHYADFLFESEAVLLDLIAI